MERKPLVWLVVLAAAVCLVAIVVDGERRAGQRKRQLDELGSGQSNADATALSLQPHAQPKPVPLCRECLRRAHPKAGERLHWHEALSGLCRTQRYRCATTGEEENYFANTTVLETLRGRTLLFGGDSTLAQQLWALVTWLGRETPPDEADPNEVGPPSGFVAAVAGEPYYKRILRDFAIFYKKCSPSTIKSKAPPCPIRCWGAALNFALCWVQMQSRVVPPTERLINATVGWTAPIRWRRGLSMFTFGIWYCWNCGQGPLLMRVTADFTFAVDRVLDEPMARPAYIWRETQPQGFKEGAYVPRGGAAVVPDLTNVPEYTPQEFKSRMTTCVDPNRPLDKRDVKAFKSGVKADPRWYLAKTLPAVFRRNLTLIKTWDIKRIRFYGRASDSVDDCTHVHVEVSQELNERLYRIVAQLSEVWPPPLANVSLDELRAVQSGRVFESHRRTKKGGSKKGGRKR